MTEHVILESTRLGFSSTSTTTAGGAAINCELTATEGVLTVAGPSGAAARVTGLAAATAASDAMPAGSIMWKQPVRVATTATIPSGTYSDGAGTYTFANNGPQMMDAISLAANDRVLVKDELANTPGSRGLYYVSTAGDGGNPSVWTRAFDALASAAAAGTAVLVKEGSTNAGNMYAVAGTAVDFGVNLTFSEIGGGGTVADDSITLAHLAHGTGEGQLLYYAGGGFTPSLLTKGTDGLPLVAGASTVSYAELTGAGLAVGIYKDSLILGNGSAQESIRFGATGESVVGIYVNNTLRISATSDGGAYAGTWTGSSDEKWKDLLGPISADPLADVDKLQSESWTWKPGFHFGDSGAFSAGVVAQQFQQVCPRAVTHNAEQDGLVVDYNAVHSFNLACIKALKQKNLDLETAVAALQARVAVVEQEHADMKARLSAVEAALASHSHP